MALCDRKTDEITFGGEATLSGATTAKDREKLSLAKAVVAEMELPEEDSPNAPMTPSQRPVSLYPLYGGRNCSSSVQSRNCGVPAMNLLRTLAEGKF